MSVDVGRWNVGTLKRDRFRPLWRWNFKRSAYGSLSCNVTILGKTVMLLRRYPNDRLRCQSCGYRKNDS